MGYKKYNTNANTIKIYTIGLCNLLVTKDKIWSECKKIYLEKKEENHSRPLVIQSKVHFD